MAVLEIGVLVILYVFLNLVLVEHIFINVLALIEFVRNRVDRWEFIPVAHFWVGLCRLDVLLVHLIPNEHV